MDILIVSPHPDDAEIGFGASMARLKEQGHQITIAVCTGAGDLTMVHSGQTVDFAQRMEEQLEAAKVVEAQVKFLNFAPASKFDTAPISELVSAFDDLFSDFDRVILPLPSYAKDHKIVFEAGLAAMRQGKKDRIEFFCYEQPMQHLGCEVDLAYGRMYIPVLGGHVKSKIEMMAKHKSQFETRPRNGLHSTEAIEAWARIIGSHVGEEYAEVMYLLRAKMRF